MRRVTKLDKARWLVVYSTDLLYAMGLLGLVQLYALRTHGVPDLVLAGAAALVVLVVVLAMRGFRLAVRGAPRPTRLLAVAGVATLLLAVLPVLPTIPIWPAMLAPWLRRRTVWLVAAGSVVLVQAVITVASGFQPAALLLQALLTGALVAGVPVNLWLWRIIKEAHEGQEARAMLAVSEERLRFARDLNDLLGQSLTGIAARAAGAEELLRADPEAAGREMFEVRDLARQSLREVRATVQSYRALDLDEVLASVRAVLEAADVRCAVDCDADTLPPETRTLLAAVVREGTTNVLKHSKAEHCTITIKEGILEMTNDGVLGPVGDHAPDGLGGLAQRVRGAGGTLVAGPTSDGGYALRMVMPA
ncbi:histidine kinase [Nonomuraea sp. MCN248]|uniref:Histidine kinase n=1 Tax=Nonomuraea corallina TaxID=2989783 RepID=A0ABT4S726_9ACTN|nr:histidine kinase [Nonomuraea corallina]MDA0633007.1 histidine kinase [Nonomuraea corallina]